MSPGLAIVPKKRLKEARVVVDDSRVVKKIETSGDSVRFFSRSYPAG
jgi:hypothetical protein